MKLTSREKILLGVLSLGIFIFVMFNYMISPTIKDIETLEITKQEKQLELAQMKGIIKREQEFIDVYNLYQKKLIEISKKYYVDLKQEDMLVLLNKLNDSKNFQIDNFSFSENLDNKNAKNQMVVRFDYNGPYHEVYNYLDNLSKNEEYIQVSNLNMDSTGDNKISGQIITNFNSIPMVQAFAEGESIFDIYGTLASRQLDSPYVRYASLAEKYVQLGEASPDEMSQMEIYMSQRTTNQINNFNSSEVFTIGSDLDIISDASLSNKRLYGQHSLNFEYDFGIKKKYNQANLVFEDELMIYQQHDFISMWVYAEEVTGHELGIVLIDSIGDDHELILQSSLDFKGWQVLEVALPIEINYPCKVQRIFVRSTNYDQRLSGSVLIDQIQTADVKELD